MILTPKEVENLEKVYLKEISEILLINKEELKEGFNSKENIKRDYLEKLMLHQELKQI